MIPSAVVVLPVPGPPVSTMNFDVTARVIACKHHHETAIRILQSQRATPSTQDRLDGITIPRT
jgi:hypothetical protein